MECLASLQVILNFFCFTFPKKWVGRAMGNETFHGAGLTAFQIPSAKTLSQRGIFLQESSVTHKHLHRKDQFRYIKFSLTQQTSARDLTNYVVIHQSLVPAFHCFRVNNWSISCSRSDFTGKRIGVPHVSNPAISVPCASPPESELTSLELLRPNLALNLCKSSQTNQASFPRTETLAA